MEGDSETGVRRDGLCRSVWRRPSPQRTPEPASLRPPPPPPPPPAPATLCLAGLRGAAVAPQKRLP